MKLIGLIIAILIASMFLGEAPLVLGYILVPCLAWVWIKHHHWISVGLTILCVAALALHVYGLKIYGSPILMQNQQQLVDAKQAVALQPPAKIIFQDGSSLQLASVYFPRPIELKKVEYDDDEDRMQLSYYLNGYRTPLEVRIEADTTNTGKAWCLRRAQYWCGNTWFATTFPRRIPRYLRADFAEILVHAGIALPTADYVRTATNRWDPLMRTFRGGYLRNLPAGDPEIIRLGRALVERSPDDFQLGAQLLTQVRDVASYPMLAEKLRASSRESKTIDPLLLIVDTAEAKKLLESYKTEKEPDVDRAGAAAEALAREGDFSGVDFLVEILRRNDLKPEYRKNLGVRLTGRFYFLTEMGFGFAIPNEAIAVFPEWYAENREKLRWLKDPNGGEGPALTNSGIFDATYRQTMDKYLAKLRGQPVP